MVFFNIISELQGLFLHLSKNQQLLIEEGANFSEEEIKNLSAVCPQDFIGCLRYSMVACYNAIALLKLYVQLSIVPFLILLLFQLWKKNKQLVSYYITW